MDGLLTVKHDFNSWFIEDHLARSRKYNKEHPYTVSPCYRDKTFRINPKWNKAYAGREEYA